MSASSPHAERWYLRPPLLLACLIFFGLGWWAAGILPVGHEEVSTFPSHGTTVLDAEFEPEPSCADPSPPTFVRSSGRPVLAVCAGGLSLPVLIAPYCSGIPLWPAALGWPLHQGNAFELRRWNLLSGLVSLLATFALVRRLADGPTAESTVLVLAVSSPFIMLHAMLFQYESMPWLLTVLGLLIALGRRGAGPPGPGRLVGACVAWGLAVVANVKAVFFFGPILLVAWRAGALRGISRRAGVLGAGVFMLSSSPLVIANLIHGGGGLESQTQSRWDLLLRETRLSQVGDELLNLLRFASDTGSYTAREWTPLGAPGVLAAAVIAAGALYVVVMLVRFLVGRSPDPLAAGCGLMVLEYLVVSLKLYDQIPSANYAPLHGVFGIMVALAVAKLAQRLAASSWGLRPRRTILVLTGLAMLPLASNTVGRVSAVERLPISYGAHAERSLVQYLLAHPAADATLYTTTYNQAGVFDSLGGGALRTIRLDEAMHCDSPAEPVECLGERWQHFFGAAGALPARIVLPSRKTLSDESSAMALWPALESAVDRAGLRLRVEYEARSANGEDAMVLVRVDETGPGT